ncbi:hypothetical protein ACLMJK_007840 [Lecanora helva]
MTLSYTVLGARLPVDEVFRRAQWDAKDRLASRQLCVEDDTLLALQADPYDSIPFCETFVSYQLPTAVSTVTTRTTTIVVATTTVSANYAETIASATTTVFVTGAPVPGHRKRQAGVVTPASALISSCLNPTGADASVLSRVSSACSCITRSDTDTTTLTVTATSTRVESAIDYEDQTVTSIVTGGIATETVIIPFIGPPVSSANVTYPGTAITYPGTAVTYPGTAVTYPGTAVTYPGIVTTLPGSVVTLSGSIITLPGSVVTLPRGGLPEATSTATPAAPSSGLPPLSVNGTIPPGPTVPPFPGGSGAPRIPSNGSQTISANGSLPTGNIVPDSCPYDNGTLYTENGQTFMILCATNFLGSQIQGFNDLNFQQCVHDCALINIGYSANDCYAASYIPNNDVGSDCFFRNLSSSEQPYYDPKVTSAILVNNTLSPSIYYNSTGAVPPFNSSSNSTSPSNASTISANSTGYASGFPTASANFTVPGFSLPSGNGRNGSAPSTAGISSGFPVPSANSTCGALATTTVTDTVAATTITATVTV